MKTAVGWSFPGPGGVSWASGASGAGAGRVSRDSAASGRAEEAEQGYRYTSSRRAHPPWESSPSGWM